MRKAPPCNPARNAGRFKLVEVMTVVGIILLLCLIAVYTVKLGSYNGAQTVTMRVFSRLDCAFYQYRADWGHYPMQPQVAGIPLPLTVSFLKNLHKPGGSAGDPASRYIQDCEQWTTASSGSNADCVVDGFGAVIYYQCPGRVNPESYDLWSAGADGLFGRQAAGETPDPARSYLDVSGATSVNRSVGGDDITNWKRD